MRDSTRQPIAVLSFLGVEPGMRALDLYAAGGYYTFVLSKAVGDKGTVIAQNTQRGRAFIEDRQNITQGDALDAKISAGQLRNVTQLVAPTSNLGLISGSIDFVLLAQTLHDYYNSDPESARALLRSLFTLVREGGIVGIIDHVGVLGFDNISLHRMLPQQAIELALEVGFDVTVSDLLRNDTDEPSRAIFDPRLARNTDRFLLRLVKPETEL